MKHVKIKYIYIEGRKYISRIAKEDDEYPKGSWILEHIADEDKD